jgi:hypothetical protein
MSEEIKEAPLTEEEAAMLEGEAKTEPNRIAADDDGEDEEEDDEPNDEPQHDVPDWAILPEGVKLPPVGTTIVFMRFEPSWLMDPNGPELQCVLWPLTEAEELMAYKRSRGDQQRSVIELAKQCVKIADGQKADWTKGKTSNVEKFWAKLGPKARHMVRNYYAKTHIVTAVESLDFFSKHFAAVTVQPKV